VRRQQKPNDYSDQAWFNHPKGTVAYEYRGPVPTAAAAKNATTQPAEWRVRQKNPTDGHH
ncbi:MAG: hypothetical protein ACMV0H_10060, partial [Aquaspirillum sp.]